MLHYISDPPGQEHQISKERVQSLLLYPEARDLGYPIYKFKNHFLFENSIEH